ncbi:MAG: hypothetical protein ABEJ92_08090 [Halobacteriales archaeon]
MCHHHEARDWADLRDQVEEAEPDGVEGEAPSMADEPVDAETELPPIQPSD